jgi:hypothetical protein
LVPWFKVEEMCDLLQTKGARKKNATAISRFGEQSTWENDSELKESVGRQAKVQSRAEVGWLTS